MRRLSCITDKLQRIAEFVLLATSPKQDRDGYHYIYDPDHRQRTPAGFGRFYKTPKGWSTNPKYQHGELPHSLSEGLTESEIEEYKKSNPIPVPASPKKISEHKQSVISKFSHVLESDIEALENLPEQLFSKVNPNRFRVLKGDNYALIPDRTGKRKHSILVKKDGSNNPNMLAHEFGHLILEESKLLENQDFVQKTKIVFAEELNDIKTEFNERFKKATDQENKPVGDVFYAVFKNNSAGNVTPKKVRTVIRALFGKGTNEVSADKLAEATMFLDGLQAISKGEYGWGHKKGYLKDSKERNDIHEFFANTVSHMSKPSSLMTRYFPKSMSFMISQFKEQRG